MTQIKEALEAIIEIKDRLDDLDGMDVWYDECKTIRHCLVHYEKMVELLTSGLDIMSDDNIMDVKAFYAAVDKWRADTAETLKQARGVK